MSDLHQALIEELASQRMDDGEATASAVIAASAEVAALADSTDANGRPLLWRAYERFPVITVTGKRPRSM